MIYDKWMSYIRDDVPITKVVMPGAHNAGSKGMNFMACCQDGSLYDQAKYGVRHFCLRLGEDRLGRIHIAHGVTRGMLLSEALSGLARALDENDTEFYILDLREYYDQKVGPIKLSFSADPGLVDVLLARYIDPQRYAYTDFDRIGDVTMGDLRKSGKRFIIVNEKTDYAYSKAAETIFPWSAEFHGSNPEYFSRHVAEYFDSDHTDGIYWFQTQETPNLGTDVGMTFPYKLDQLNRPFFPEMIERIRTTPSYLEQANVIEGDFMTLDYMKVRLIISLNLDKGTVKEELREEFAKGLETV
ncbi:MAG: hypothetical protein K6C36_05685 [Clostridia bacterium]|nr:hypothetical protein [Clostridia bacterium]